MESCKYSNKHKKICIRTFIICIKNFNCRDCAWRKVYKKIKQLKDKKVKKKTIRKIKLCPVCGSKYFLNGSTKAVISLSCFACGFSDYGNMADRNGTLQEIMEYKTLIRVRYKRINKKVNKLSLTLQNLRNK